MSINLQLTLAIIAMICGAVMYTTIGLIFLDHLEKHWPRLEIAARNNTNIAWLCFIFWPITYIVFVFKILTQREPGRVK